MKFHGKIAYVSEVKRFKLKDQEGGQDCYVDVIIEGVGSASYRILCKLFHAEPAEMLSRQWKSESEKLKYCGVFDIDFSVGEKKDIHGNPMYYQSNRLYSWSFVQPKEPSAYQNQ